jgi:hypothetical protein
MVGLEGHFCQRTSLSLPTDLSTVANEPLSLAPPNRSNPT